MSSAAKVFRALVEDTDARICLPDLSGDTLWNFDGFPRTNYEIRRMLTNVEVVRRLDEDTFHVQTSDIDEAPWTIVVRVRKSVGSPVIVELVAVQRGQVPPVIR